MLHLNRRLPLVLACLCFLCLGLTNAAIGPVLPNMAARTGADLATLGSIFSALFLGGVLGQLAAGPLADRFGQRPVLLFGLSGLTLGFCGIAAGRTLGLILASALVAGLGQGATELGSTVLAANLYAHRRTSALNMLHLFFGIGAVVGPALVGLALALTGSGFPAIWLGVAMAAVLVPLAWRFIAPRSPVALATHQQAQTGNAGVYRSPLLWMLAVVLMLYVGTEMGTGGWLATIMQRTAGFSAENASLVVSGYWLALTAGRMFSVLLGTRVVAEKLLLIDLGGAVAASLLLGLSLGNAGLSVFGAVLLGLSFGSVYPTIMAIVTGIFTADPGKASGVTSAMGSLGGMTLPWLQGLLLERQSPASSVWFILIGAAAMLGLFAVSRLLPARRMPGDVLSGPS